MAISDLLQRPPTAPAQTCQTCHALSVLPPDKAATLVELLSNASITYQELSDELRTDPDWLLDIDRQSLSRHARGIGRKHSEKLR